VAGDNLAPAADATAASSGMPSARGLKKAVSAFAANGGAATLAVRKVAAALKVAQTTFTDPCASLDRIAAAFNAFVLLA
jgi:hypothetical protein